MKLQDILTKETLLNIVNQQIHEYSILLGFSGKEMSKKEYSEYESILEMWHQAKEILENGKDLPINIWEQIYEYIAFTEVLGGAVPISDDEYQQCHSGNLML